MTGLIRSLVGIRGVFSAIVVIVHLAPFAIALTPVSAPFWNFCWQHGYPVLDLFIVLSGFVVTAGYRATFARWPGADAYGRFLWARLSRFYPLHLVVLAGLLGGVATGALLGFAVPHTGDFGEDLVRQVLLLQGWGGAHTLTWNGPTWSLSAEWFCYLLMPLIVPVVLRFRTQGAVLAGYAAAMAVPLVAYGFLGYGDGPITYGAPLYRAVSDFVAGALLCQLTHVRSRVPELAGRGTGLLALVFGGAVLAAAALGVTLLAAVPFGGLFVLGLAQQRGRVNAVLASPFALKAGDLSVSLFLTHVPWILGAALVVTPARFPGAWGWLGVAILVVGAVVIAYAALVLVERPAQRLMRAWVPSRRGVDQGAMVVPPPGTATITP
jgi:peptidoglycan/LPS O-acetylase OafA/YrhL